MDIGYRCPSAPIYAITCCHNDLFCGELTQAITNLNAYKGNMFICVLLPTIVLIVHIIIEKWSLPFGIYTMIALSLMLSGICLEHLYNLLLNVAPQNSRSFLTMLAMALNCSRPLQDHPLPLSLSVVLSYWRRTLEKVYWGTLIEAHVLCWCTVNATTTRGTTLDLPACLLHRWTSMFQLTMRTQIACDCSVDLHKVITRAQVLTFLMSLAYSACQRAE